MPTSAVVVLDSIAAARPALSGAVVLHARNADRSELVDLSQSGSAVVPPRRAYRKPRRPPLLARCRANKAAARRLPPPWRINELTSDLFLFHPALWRRVGRQGNPRVT